MIEPSLSSWKVEVDLVAPEFGIVVKGPLDVKKINAFDFQEMKKNISKPSRTFVRDSCLFLCLLVCLFRCFL